MMKPTMQAPTKLMISLIFTDIKKGKGKDERERNKTGKMLKCTDPSDMTGMLSQRNISKPRAGYRDIQGMRQSVEQEIALPVL